MRIGIDATTWQNRRGFGRFTRELLRSILETDGSNEYLFFLDDKTPGQDEMPERAAKVVVKTSRQQISAAAAGGRRSLGDLWAMGRSVYRHDLDLFFFPAVYSYFPVFNRTKVIVTLHDVIADHHPDLIFPDRRSRQFWKLKQWAALRRADLILTVSNHSKEQICSQLGVSASRVRVVTEGADRKFRARDSDAAAGSAIASYGIDSGDEFLLYVGGISPHKNLGRLIESFGILCREIPDRRLKLLLVGDNESDPFFSAYPSLKKQIAESEMNDRVVFTGYVPDDHLVELYNSALLLVFPSFEEGFGLPAVEAMACGTPVAASSRGSLPEVVGDAGEYFDPLSVGEIADVVKGMISDADRMRVLSANALRRAREFSWKKAAEQTLAVFEELAG